MKAGQRSSKGCTLSHAPSFLDGVVAIRFRNTLHAFDAATGKRLWTLPVSGDRAADIMAWHREGHKPAFVVPAGGPSGVSLVAIDVHDGKQIWSVELGKPERGGGGGMLARSGDVAVWGNAAGLAAVRIGANRAERLWFHPDGYNYRCQVPVIFQGHVFTFHELKAAYAPSGKGANCNHHCWNLETGEEVAWFNGKTSGFRRWKDHHGILSNGTMFSFSGAIKADPKDFRPLAPKPEGSSGRDNPLPVEKGRWNPIMYMCPLIVDGHFIAHCSKHIVSWDLRAK